jgi:hypothetical protein
MMHSHPRSGNAAWLRNRILGGNARDERSYAQLVRGEPADMAFLDPLFAAAVGRKSSCKAVSRCGSAGHGHVPVAWITAFAIAASGADDEHSHAGARLSMAWQWRYIVAPDTISDCGGAVAKGVGKMNRVDERTRAGVRGTLQA